MKTTAISQSNFIEALYVLKSCNLHVKSCIIYRVNLVRVQFLFRLVQSAFFHYKRTSISAPARPISRERYRANCMYK